jgi:hypothetical protein
MCGFAKSALSTDTLSYMKTADAPLSNRAVLPKSGPGQDSARYDGEKIVFFGQRIVERENGK